MNVQLFLSLLLLGTSLLSGCTGQHPVNRMDRAENDTEVTAGADIAASVPDDTQIETELQEAVPVMTVNGIPLEVVWEENETVAELLACAENRPVTVNTTIYGGFEQVGALPQSFSRNDAQMTTEPGDIVLYSGNQLVLFFGSNSWSYTKLGQIHLTADELTELLSGDTSVIEISAIS